MRHLLSFSAALMWVVLAGACAKGTADGLVDSRTGGGADANPNAADAWTGFPPDAKLSWPDANTSLPDAFVSPPDAAGGGDGTCTTSAECTFPLDCCIDDGNGGGVCFVDPGIPGFCM